jgi:hypothetical protein
LGCEAALNGGSLEVVGWHILWPEDIRCMEEPEEVARGAAKPKEQARRRRRREEELREYGELPAMGRNEEEMIVRSGENVRMVSWIWSALGTVGSDKELRMISH